MSKIIIGGKNLVNMVRDICLKPLMVDGKLSHGVITDKEKYHNCCKKTNEGE